MPGLVHAFDSYASTVAALRNITLIGVALIILAVLLIRRNNTDIQ